MPGGFARPSDDTFVWTAGDAAAALSVPTTDDHKYSRGVVLLRTGSPAFPGAAVLTAEGAWRAGAGLVRWQGDKAVGRLVLQRRPETVVNASGRIDAAVIGSGIAGRERTERDTNDLRSILRAPLPTVVDAGGLDLLTDARGPVVVTPHEAELADVRIALGLGIDDLDADPLKDRLRGGFDERLMVVRETAVALSGAVLLKGAETIVATPSGWWTVVRAGTPWLATAGTGDVLAGVMGALVSGAARRGDGALDVEDLGPLAATAAWLHGTAARIAAGELVVGQDGAAHASGRTGRPVTAIDVAERVPEAYESALHAV